MTSRTQALWFIGQFASIAIGVSVALAYGVPVGAFAGSVLFVLVDIRREVSK